MGNQIANISLESSNNSPSRETEILASTDVTKLPHFSPLCHHYSTGTNFSSVRTDRRFIFGITFTRGKIIHEENSIEVMEEEEKIIKRNVESEKKSTISPFLLKRLAKEPSIGKHGNALRWHLRFWLSCHLRRFHFGIEMTFKLEAVISQVLFKRSDKGFCGERTKKIKKWKSRISGLNPELLLIPSRNFNGVFYVLSRLSKNLCWVR